MRDGDGTWVWLWYITWEICEFVWDEGSWYYIQDWYRELYRPALPGVMRPARLRSPFRMS